MSEDLNPSSGEPEEPEQSPLEEASAPQEPAPAVLQEAERVQSVSELIPPEQPVDVSQPQYPPPPEFYAQMPVVDPYAYKAPVVAPPPVYQYPVQGMPVFPAPGYGLPSFPQAHPLPLGQAIRELPRQYKKILFKPGMRSFAEEQGKADWGIIWIQLLFLMIIGALASIPILIIYNQTLYTIYSNMPSLASEAAAFTSPALIVGEVILEALFAPLVFFVSVGIQYLVARAFKGQGLFKQQVYNQLLFQVPMQLVSSVLVIAFMPFLRNIMTSSLTSTLSPSTSMVSATSLSGSYLAAVSALDLVSLVIGVYTIILTVFSIMAVHRMSGGRATGSVLIPYGVLILLAFLCICALAVVTAVAVSGR